MGEIDAIMLAKKISVHHHASAHTDDCIAYCGLSAFTSSALLSWPLQPMPCDGSLPWVLDEARGLLIQAAWVPEQTAAQFSNMPGCVRGSDWCASPKMKKVNGSPWAANCCGLMGEAAPSSLLTDPQ